MNRKQLMVDSHRVDGSTCKPTTRKPATSNQPAFALLLLAGTLLLLALAFLSQSALAATPITTCAELQNIRGNLGGGYYLANDIDCSGFDYGDVIVGAKDCYYGQAREGRAFVYHGSSSELPTSSSWSAESDQEAARFGCSVATAGDVNEGGCEDVIAGADEWRQITGDMPQARYGHRMVNLAGNAYIFGGLALLSARCPLANDIWKYSPDEDVWEEELPNDPPEGKIAYMRVRIRG